VIEKSLAGPIGVFVKFSTLQEYGVDKVFFLENDNVDTSQRNIIFLARGEKATQPMAIAGTSEIMTCLLPNYVKVSFYSSGLYTQPFSIYIVLAALWDLKVDYVDPSLLYLVSLDP
jgi:hypothetical protein